MKWQDLRSVSLFHGGIKSVHVNMDYFAYWLHLIFWILDRWFFSEKFSISLEMFKLEASSRFQKKIKFSNSLSKLCPNLSNKYDKPVYVHCWGGKGRTGAVVGCYLVRHGFAAGNDVIEKIKELRKNTEDFSDPSPETKEQINMVINWKKELWIVREFLE